MSSEFERQLRDAREALPVPDERSTQAARGRAVVSLRRRRRRSRALLVAAAMLVSAVALGVTAGSLNAPSVTAAREPAELGFVPEPGWFALQSPPPAIEGQQTAAVAANVPFAADDVENGLVEPSGLPYSTLLTLPSDGIVIVVNMTPQTDLHLAPIPTNPYYPELELPLRFRDAAPYVQWGAQVRPDEPLAQYQLRGEIDGINAEVTIYFGTARPSSELRAAAQRQLARLVVRPGPANSNVDATASAPAPVLTVFDRTYACNTVQLGGLNQVEVRTHAGQRVGGRWAKLPYAALATGGNAGRPDASIPPVNILAWLTAGEPTRDTSVDDSYDSFTVHTVGTFGRNTELCQPSTARVELSHAGLRGGAAGVETRTYDCDVARRVLVRIRATTLVAAPLRERGRIFLATSAVVQRAELAVGTPAGKLLAYAAVDRSGRSEQYATRRGCVLEH
jgi:hypothetical protein